MSPMYRFPTSVKDLSRVVNKNPLLYGIPFVMLMVGASFGLTAFTQTRYELHDQRVQNMTKEQQLGLEKTRKQFDIRETYFKISSDKDQDNDNWDPSAQRIGRPKGLAEWGEAPAGGRPDVPEERQARNINGRR